MYFKNLSRWGWGLKLFFFQNPPPQCGGNAQQSPSGGCTTYSHDKTIPPAFFLIRLLPHQVSHIKGCVIYIVHLEISAMTPPTPP